MIICTWLPIKGYKHIVVMQSLNAKFNTFRCDNGGNVDMADV